MSDDQECLSGFDCTDRQKRSVSYAEDLAWVLI